MNTITYNKQNEIKYFNFLLTSVVIELMVYFSFNIAINKNLTNC